MDDDPQGDGGRADEGKDTNKMKKKYESRNVCVSERERGGGERERG